MCGCTIPCRVAIPEVHVDTLWVIPHLLMLGIIPSLSIYLSIFLSIYPSLHLSRLTAFFDRVLCLHFRLAPCSGPEQAAFQHEALHANGITHIIDLSNRKYAKRKDLFEYLSLQLEDSPHTNILSVFSRTNRFIESALNEDPKHRGREGKKKPVNKTSSSIETPSSSPPTSSSLSSSPSSSLSAQAHSSSSPQFGRVLVHCQAGVSRSASVVIAFLLFSRRFSSLSSALAFVRKTHPRVAPNDGFLSQLKAYEISLAHDRLLGGEERCDGGRQEEGKGCEERKEEGWGHSEGVEEHSI